MDRYCRTSCHVKPCLLCSTCRPFWSGLVNCVVDRGGKCLVRLDEGLVRRGALMCDEFSVLCSLLVASVVGWRAGITGHCKCNENW